MATPATKEIPTPPQQTNGTAAAIGAISPLHFATGEESFSFCGPHKPLQEWEEILKLPTEVDRTLHAWMGKMTLGISPASLILAYQDWFLHLAAYPTKQQELAIDAVDKTLRFWRYATARVLGEASAPCIEGEERDDRFKHNAWEQFPFALYAQGFLLMQDWWKGATNGIHGVSQHHSDIVSFMTRQWLDMLSPSNFFGTNPEVITTTIEQGGENLLRGGVNFLADIRAFIHNELPRGTENFIVGEDLATSHGRVVFRNRLFELIQYEPKTARVHPEPVLITPAWIMKYYILDLSPHNSLVKYLLKQGHTVFMISWKNPGKEDANLGMEDYLKEGMLKAMDIVAEILPDRKIQGMGYCLGGTLITIAAAYMARHGDNRLKSLTLLTAQLDYQDAGELLMFIDESQLAYLEDLMWEQGYLSKWQLSGAFGMLRSKDLIWSRVVREYLLGEEEQMFDLLAWNVDATRLPYKMHSEYLRQLYLNNDLAEHRYRVEDKLILLSDIAVPVFAIATRRDHIAPWRSVYKLHELLNTDLTFLLTNGGHNSGIVSPPGHKRRKYQMSAVKSGDGYQPPQRWLDTVETEEGSWWPVWQQWLKSHSGNKVMPPEMGAPARGYPPLEAAPGRYVHIK